MREIRLHATCISLENQGVLIQGPPGSGKSDLALRLMDSPGFAQGQVKMTARLVADDQVIVTRDGDRLHASAPLALAGKLEIRGLGIVDAAFAKQVRLCIAVRLSGSETIERMPDPEACHIDILGCRLPLLMIDPVESSAPAKVRAAVIHFAGRV